MSKAGIVDAALGILDQYGLADLSMRRIADALGVQAAAIYWHFANKQTLLAAVSDAILAGQAPCDESMSIAGWACDLREVLLSHRDAAELVAASLAVGLCTRIPDAGAVERGAERRQVQCCHPAVGDDHQPRLAQQRPQHPAGRRQQPVADEDVVGAGPEFHPDAV